MKNHITQSSLIHESVDPVRAILLLLAAAATSAAASTNIGTIEQALRGGEVTLHEGVLQVCKPYWDFNVANGWERKEHCFCTGFMIAKDVALTAAHCLPYESATQGSKALRLWYYDPEQGRRLVFDGNADWNVLLTYDGSGGAGGANDDLGVIQIPGRFTDTDHHDYLRIYSDFGRYLEEDDLLVYGQGYHTYSEKIDDWLRMSWFEVENAEYYHVVLDNRKKVTLCKGDSGGPWMHLISSGVDNVPVVAALSSNVDIDGVCANNAPPFDDAFGCRLNWQRLQWIEEIADISCPLFTGLERDYRRCFDLPFIEDVEWEGIDRDIAIAQVVAAVL